jgi:hypothetical protein
VFIIAPLHLLYVNTRLLPEQVRPSMRRHGALVVMSLFCGFFVTLSLRNPYRDFRQVLWHNFTRQHIERTHEETCSPPRPRRRVVL